MKSGFIRLTCLSALLVTSPWITFAGDKDAKVYPSAKAALERTETPSLVPNQGKGSGLTISGTVLRVNAWREQTTEDRQSVKSEPVTQQPKWHEPAFTK